MRIADFFSEFRKTVEFNYNKQKFFFDVSQMLFSSANIDKGTFQLIDSFRKNKEINYKNILDLGCGYGPIGIFLKKFYPDSDVHCVDKDALALEFSKHNAKLNNCEIKVYPSIDYQNVKQKFDLICCNYPAKAGEKALKKIVHEASKYLKQKGIFAIVIVDTLLENFKKVLTNEIEILHKKESSGYAVFHLKYKKELDVNEDAYFRNNVDYKIENKNYKLKTIYSVAEFESPSFTTMSMIEISKEVQSNQNVFIIDPLQGHLPIAIFHHIKPKKLTLISRDLLSLKYSNKNLLENGFRKIEFIHKVMPEKEKADLLIWRLDEKLEYCQIKKILKNIENNFTKIIIGTNKSKLKKIIRQLNLKPSKEKEYENSMSILISSK